jgi:rhodanese-related sulfurtransferase
MVVVITPNELAGILASHDADVIDVRNPDEWNAGHIEGTRLLPLDQLRVDPDAVLVRGTAIVFVCAKGVRSMTAAKLAERFGYERVYNLDGGTKAWAEQGLPLVTETRVAA